MSEATTELRHGFWWGVGAAAGAITVCVIALIIFSLIQCSYVPAFLLPARSAPISVGH